jgi:hypothetical protein
VAIYVVLIPDGGSVPPPNTPVNCGVFQGDYASAALAVQAAASAYNLPRDKHLWVMAASALTEYLTSITTAAA